jgi:hypothetical protein
MTPAVEDHDLPRDGEAGDEDPSSGQKLSVGWIGDRASDRPDEPSPPVEAVDPPSNLGDEETAVSQRRIPVWAGEAARRVVVAAAAEDSGDPLCMSQLDVRQFWMSAITVRPFGRR